MARVGPAEARKAGLPEIEVPVPEWGGEVALRPPTSAESARIAEMAEAAEGTAASERTAAYIEWIFANLVVPPWPQEEIDWLYEHGDSRPVTRVIRAVTEMANVDPPAPEEVAAIETTFRSVRRGDADPEGAAADA